MRGKEEERGEGKAMGSALLLLQSRSQMEVKRKDEEEMLGSRLAAGQLG